MLDVTDDGLGIPAEALPHVFKRFFRVDGSRSREQGGAGLGLSIVKSICTAHGAQVEVISTPGKGSTFRVRQPLAAEAAAHVGAKRMSLVQYVLRRPYTVVALLILIALLGIGEALRMPVDIFPEMDIPVCSVVWTYAGMDAEDIQNRILTLHERQMASLVDDISRIEATSYEGVGVEKVYLHEGADVTRAVAQLASSALVVLKYMPPSITPPLVIRYGATDVPIIQLSLSSNSLPDTALNDLGQNIIRPALAVVHGAEVPYPYGGKPRVIMADLDQQALQARGLTPPDVSNALQTRTSFCRRAT